MKYIAYLLLLLATPSFAATAKNAHVLTTETGLQKTSLTAEKLLADPRARKITIKNDGAYAKTMAYTAIPLAALLAGMNIPSDSVIEAVAKDGFVASLPTELVLHPKDGGAQAYLAIEPPDAPWPPLKGKKESAGPFYVVWTNAGASGIRSEQWPYMVVTLRAAESPAKKWKQLAVDPALPADAPAREGQALFATQCMSCHQLNGAGSADAGPDLNLPMNPTEYFRPGALKQYIRDPSSLRHWDAMQMHGFDKAALSDHDIDQIIAYLEHMAGHKAAPKKD